LDKGDTNVQPTLINKGDQMSKNNNPQVNLTQDTEKSLNKTILRQAHKKNYTCYANDLPQNNYMSLRARGLMFYLLSLPDDWKIHINHLNKVLLEGRVVIASVLEELKRLGYIHHQKMGFKEGWEYFVFESPKTSEQFKEYLRTIQVYEQFANTNSSENTPPLQSNNSSTKEVKIKERSGSVDPPPPEIVCKREKFIEVAPKVKLTEKQTHELIKKYGKQDYETFIHKLSDYKIKTNKVTSSDYRAILKWVVGAVHNEKQDVVIKQRIKESNLKGLQEIYDHLVRTHARGDLRWNDKNGIVQDVVLNRTANLESSKLLHQVANWYGLTWEEGDGN